MQKVLPKRFHLNGHITPVSSADAEVGTTPHVFVLFSESEEVKTLSASLASFAEILVLIVVVSIMSYPVVLYQQ